MKEKAASILQSVLGDLNAANSFEEQKKIIRKRVNCLIENNYPRTSSPFETDDNFVTTQKAYIYILKILRESSTMEELEQKLMGRNC